ncbi:MAG: DUF1501 domain-containing protein [Deltaproteobacteria bacterium]|nr:DUF1501 domain-containing protein [Deltaproteobacteria bacterium]
MTKHRCTRSCRGGHGHRRPNRRTVLGGLASLGGLAAFGAGGPLVRVARADDGELEDRYYIFCYFDGGWDLLMSLDPRDPAVFRDDIRKTTRIQPGYDRLPSQYRELVPTSVPEMTFGPAIGDLRYAAEKMCVVRGLSMDTLTHEVGRRRFLTGRPPTGLQAKGSSLATLLASCLGSGQPMPQLSVLVESYNANQPSWSSAVRVSSVQDLLRALTPATTGLPDGLQALADDLLADQGAQQAFASRFHQDALDFRRAGRSLVDQGLGDRFDFAAETAEMQALRDLYGIEPDDLTSSAAQCASAVVAVTSGISRSVSIVVTDGLDSHGPEWASEHPARLRSGFDLVKAMVDDLETREFGDTGESWLDRTTIVGFSEFGRSTLVNSSGGRDHFLHNACFLMGGGVQGGRVIGATSDQGMAPTTTDLVTGLPSPGGVIVNPEHIYRALLTGAGITEDIGEYGVDPLMAIYG